MGEFNQGWFIIGYASGAFVAFATIFIRFMMDEKKKK